MSEPDDLDRILDHALGAYCRVEPPPGAAERWAARATAVPRLPGWLYSPLWALAAAVAGVLLAVNLLMPHHSAPTAVAAVAASSHVMHLAGLPVHIVFPPAPASMQSSAPILLGATDIPPDDSLQPIEVHSLLVPPIAVPPLDGVSQ